MTLRSQFSKTVSALLDEEPKLVVLLGDIGVYAMRDAMAKHPTRCLNIGICELASVDFAAGLAMSGFIPLFHTIDSFMVRRAYEAIYIGFGLQRLPGIFVSVGGSSDYAKLGPTHQCKESPALMAQIPGMQIGLPFKKEHIMVWLRRAVKDGGLHYIRIEESLADRPLECEVVSLLHTGASYVNGHATGPQR